MVKPKKREYPAYRGCDNIRRGFQVFKAECGFIINRVCNYLGVRVLENHSHGQPGSHQVIADILSIDFNPAVIRHQQAVQMSEQGCFPGTVPSGQENKFTRLDRERDVPDAASGVSKAMGELRQFNDRGIHNGLVIIS